jgi:hypothetical protein
MQRLDTYVTCIYDDDIRPVKPAMLSSVLCWYARQERGQRGKMTL